MEPVQADSEHAILLPRPPTTEMMGACQQLWRFSDVFSLGKKGNPECGISQRCSHWPALLFSPSRLPAKDPLLNFDFFLCLVKKKH